MVLVGSKWSSATFGAAWGRIHHRSERGRVWGGSASEDDFLPLETSHFDTLEEGKNRPGCLPILKYTLEWRWWMDSDQLEL